MNHKYLVYNVSSKQYPPIFYDDLPESVVADCLGGLNVIVNLNAGTSHLGEQMKRIEAHSYRHKREPLPYMDWHGISVLPKDKQPPESYAQKAAKLFPPLLLLIALCFPQPTNAQQSDPTDAEYMEAFTQAETANAVMMRYHLAIRRTQGIEGPEIIAINNGIAALLARTAALENEVAALKAAQQTQAVPQTITVMVPK